ncbi:class I SAM-dependent methyltransferase [Aequorivita sediminis]|uniref:class I SAM-dependent methyltransferase n=1 Tax=Aequorivita sediminis TaxID=3073653 RepID=UPI0028ACDB73|nr:class I SAM-dependent methyltransferase [Aequorivita sp. F6058]
MECTLCNTILHNKVDEFYFICDGCGAYVKHKRYYLNSDAEKKRYQEHNNDIDNPGYQKFTSPITNAILENQIPEQLGLDYGSGTGPVISKQLINKGYKVILHDPYFNPNKDFVKYSYDYIFSCEVFEHFYNPKQEIEMLLKILKPGGRLYIMTYLYTIDIDFANWYYRNDPTHIFIYTSKTIEYITDKYNLVTEKLTARVIIVSKK